MGYFVLGALCTLLTTEMAKSVNVQDLECTCKSLRWLHRCLSHYRYKIGRLRPYFMAACKISLTKDLCKDEHGYTKFVTNYTCPGDPFEVREASKSFLSGHSSFSFYCATFLVVYLHARLSNYGLEGDAGKGKPYHTLRNIFKGLKILRPFLQFGIFSLAYDEFFGHCSSEQH